MDETEKRFGLLALVVVAALVAVALLNLRAARQAEPAVHTVPYSALLDQVRQDRIREVTIDGQAVSGEQADGSGFRSVAPVADAVLLPLLLSHRVEVRVLKVPEASAGAGWLATLLPVVLLIGTLWFFNRRAPAAAGAGRTAPRMLRKEVSVTFADVAGVDEARASLQEIVEFLRNPKHASSLGGRIPRGVLLAGPPGTGKTLLARAIAGEAGVPFFTVSGSDFVEMFVGVGASRVRSMFEQARRHAPCILFIDEIDAVGRRRGQGGNAGSDEREQTLNQLLVGLDGFDSNEGVIMIAATNRPDVLDPALLRPGRFDREIVVDNPDRIGREQILAVHARRIALDPAVKLALVARGTPGFSGADLMNLVNEAALLAVRRGHASVGMAEFEDAKDTVTMGAERRAQLMTPQERRMTAWREGGRALVALHLPGADPVHKATIVTRGRSTGMVKQLPEHDAVSLTLPQMHARLAIHMAGRAAEELLGGADGLTSAGEFDIEAATRLARRMVVRYGLSSLGPVSLGPAEDDDPSPPVAQTTATRIDEEIRSLLKAGLERAAAVLRSRRGALETVAEALLQQETLTGEQIRTLLASGSQLPTAAAARSLSGPAPLHSQPHQRAQDGGGGAHGAAEAAGHL